MGVAHRRAAMQVENQNDQDGNSNARVQSRLQLATDQPRAGSGGYDSRAGRQLPRRLPRMRKARQLEIFAKVAAAACDMPIPWRGW